LSIGQNQYLTHLIIHTPTVLQKAATTRLKFLKETLMDIVILIDLEKGYYICLITKKLLKEQRLLKTATAIKNSIIYF